MTGYLAALLLFAAQDAAQDSAQHAAQEAPFERGEASLFNGKDDVASYSAALAAFEQAPPTGLLYARRAEAYLRLADITDDKKKKLALYEQGRDAAKQGIALDRKCAPCHFWLGANLGRWGQTRGVLDSLFLLDDVKAAFNSALKINPSYLDARLSLGKIDEAVPGFAGGSVERAERTFRDVVKQDPHFTRALLDLAELLAREDNEDEAKRWALRALKEQAPTFPGEHRKFDVARAKKLLSELAE